MYRRSTARVLVAFVLSVVVIAGCSSKEEAAPINAPNAANGASVAPMSHADEVQQWKDERRTRLTSATGWLTLSGLSWLKQGENSVGSDPENDVDLPAGKTAARLGKIVLGPTIEWVSEPGAVVANGGKPVTRLALTSDENGADPTILTAGSVNFNVIKRGDRMGVRVRDTQSDVRQKFLGLDYYPTEERWRVAARFEPYTPVKKIPILNVTNMIEEQDSPGALVFTIDGKELRLDPVIEEGSEDWFVMFADETNGAETYGAGRYLYVKPVAAGGQTYIDFNKAYNPPCAFTDFATCPLPPKQNKLALAIPSGEKKYRGGH